VVDQINQYIVTNKILHYALPEVKKNKSESAENICDFFSICPAKYRYDVRFKTLSEVLNSDFDKEQRKLFHAISEIDKQFNMVNTYFSNVKKVMDDAIYGHEKAKMQLERIICQWINGEQDGHCFGFEGPPGVGKTSLAKHGLSMCLTDENGVGRPFAMIQIGGDSNGSSLHGHNYTYVGSNWGSIVQILIDKKCMNPIIFIDEVDKISKTEQGREIVGILTHLLDSTQNDCFQDKYFSGVDIDMSKALFILSYNDPESIDKILLDRIHRIKFANLSVEEKIVICKKHILPEICKKMGLVDSVEASDEIIKFVIEEYTCEPGVRKLKELWFEIIGEINKSSLNKMSGNNEDATVPSIIKLTKEMITAECLKERKMIRRKKIHRTSVTGIINGLWANAMGQGGVIQIQTHFSPSSKFLDLNLTGSQGDVMKESMSVALTLAWSLTPTSTQKELKSRQDTRTPDGIHIHCPEGATPKDGPSAGTAITCAIYSLLNDKKIKHHFAITGEISLDGRVTEIGGLDLKILGGIKAGVTEFIYPEENQLDFEKWEDKYKDTGLFDGIKFHKVSHIEEVFKLIFE
jgi:endopeptidase La